MRKVYLDKVDINEFSKLTLSFNNPKNYLLYFIAYGIVADKVIMQGSASLKSELIQSIFLKLKDAFSRDEHHDFSNPIFSFSLSNNAESYSDYLKKRLSKLKGSNAEINAYKNNNSIHTALELDKSLKFVNIYKPSKSVSKVFKKSTLIDINSLQFKDIESGNKFKNKAIIVANDLETFQSFNYIKALNIKSKQLNQVLYKLIRRNYLSANAMANESICTFDSIHFKEKNLFKFLKTIGILDFLEKNITFDASLLVFYLRLNSSILELKEFYFKCQSEKEILELLERIEKIKKHGKYKALIKESPSAIISAFFTNLNENNIGFKSINKAGELLAKATISDALDTHLSKEFIIIVSLLEKLDIEIKAIEKKINT